MYVHTRRVSLLIHIGVARETASRRKTFPMTAPRRCGVTIGPAGRTCAAADAQRDLQTCALVATEATGPHSGTEDRAGCARAV